MNPRTSTWGPPGARPRAPLAFQIAELELRLRKFSEGQADWVAQGWRIIHAEQKADPSSVLMVDGVGTQLRGTIDRIDRNEGTGDLAVLDYKSGAKVEHPEKTHHRRDRGWIDLQLPLYRHLLAGLNLSGKIHLGYVAIPNDVTAIDEMLAAWDETALAEAD